jgi:hypothetical protein
VDVPPDGFVFVSCSARETPVNETERRPFDRKGGHDDSPGVKNEKASSPVIFGDRDAFSKTPAGMIAESQTNVKRDFGGVRER